MKAYKKTGIVLSLSLAIFILFCSFVGARELAAPESLEIRDTPSDRGDTLLISWHKIPQESEELEYIIYRSASPEGPFEEIERFPTNEKYASDLPQFFGFKKENEEFHAFEVDPIWETKQVKSRTVDGEWKTSSKKNRALLSFYKIGITNGETTVQGEKIVSGTPVQNWFRKNRINGLCFLVIMFFFVLYYISKAQRNPNIFLRMIPGINAVDEAVGRATEMGKPILYSTGYYDISELSTICSVNILAHVAKKVAQYDSRLIVPCKWPIAMTVCQEVVREAYINAGRPDAFNIDDIFSVAGEQFSYTIGVDSIMVREKPAANFFLGTFAAEALILAETGATTGAIQIAGTDSNYQIPFFVVACDYCLIGEELYAASAYLGRNPKLVGTLKAQDAGKLLLFTLLIVGTIMVTFGAFYKDADFLQYIRQFFLVR